jgi:cysteine-rich repeat protein
MATYRCRWCRLEAVMRDALLIALLVLLHAPRLFAQERIAVAPTGMVTWDALVQAESVSGARAAQAVWLPPRMSPPPPLDLDDPWLRLPPAKGSGGVARSAPGVALLPAPPVVGPSFQALADNGSVIPPDTNGAVGPSHVMTMLNSQVRIQNKMGGIISTVSLSTFWTGGTGLSGNPFDPRLRYDAIHGRWIASAGANQESSVSRVWFALSASNDPTGSWTFYEFVADSSGQSWADYPCLGYNTTWMAITANMFPVSNPLSLFDGAKMWVIDASTALAGGPLIATVFPKFFDVAGGVFSFTLHPAETFGPQPKLYLIDIVTVAAGGGAARVRMSEITGTGPSPVWSPTVGSLLPGSGLFAPTNDFDGIIGAEQLGMPSTCLGGSFNGQACRTTADCNFASGGVCRRIDGGDAQVAANPIFRNGRIWFTHAGGLPYGAVDRTAVFWYELDPALMASSGAPIVQSGIIQGTAGSHLFYPSIAVNAADDAAIGFSRSDAGRYVETAAATRVAGSPPGTFAPVVQLKPGEDGYFKAFGGDRNRWGDYSSTVVDPADDTSFWTIQEYAAIGDQWATWWAKLQAIAVCGDGIREGAEECDDGNTLNGDCCSSTCQAVLAGTPCAADGNPCTDDVCDGTGSCGVPNSAPCNDGDPCTTGDACSGGVCGGTAVSCDDGNLCTQDSCVPMVGCAYLAQPRSGCHGAGRALLLLKQDAGDDGKDKLIWKWLKGTTPSSDFGTPTATTDYALCIYTGPSHMLLAPPLDLPAGPQPWTPISTVGWAYDDPANPDGMQKGTLKSSLGSKAKIILKGHGTNLPDPTLPLATPVTVQLVNDVACWEADYPSAQKATARIFKAKH